MPESISPSPDNNSMPLDGSGGTPVQPPEKGFTGKRSWRRYFREKYVFIPLLIFILIPVIGLLIATRYTTLGLVSKQNYSVEVVDIRTLQPVIGAKLTIQGQIVQTNKFGQAEFTKLKVGNTPLTITKDYYSSLNSTALVPLTNHHAHIYFLSCSGFEQPIQVVNRINKSPINDAVISYGSAAAITDTTGKTVIALPLIKSPLGVIVNAPGYNSTPTLVNEGTSNVLEMTPTGKVYYLASANGSINLMETNLDGSDAQLILPGTSQQTLDNTTLEHSNDWKYLALFTTRSNSTPSIYLFDTSNNKMSTIDQDPLGFDYYGWTPNDSLIYQFIHTTLGAGQGNGSKLKAYDAATGKSYILDTTDELGYDSLAYSSEKFVGANILANGTILYTKAWTAANQELLSGSSTTFNSVQPDGSSKQRLESLDSIKYPSAPKVVFVSPTSVNLSFTSPSASSTYFSYSDGKISQTTSPSVIATISNPPTASPYYLSPTGSSVMWSTSSISSTYLSVGDSSGNKSSSVATLSTSFSPLGWYSDDYILVSQSGDHMYILPSSGINNQANILSITSYQ